MVERVDGYQRISLWIMGLNSSEKPELSETNSQPGRLKHAK